MTRSVRTLSYWGLVSLNGDGPYLAGYEVGQGTRTSTPLCEFDPVAGTALTSSGRPYRLVGDPLQGYGIATAIDVWSQYFDLSESTIRSLAVEEAVAMIAANGNAPYNRTVEEETALRRQYGIPLSVDDLISQDVTSNLDRMTAAALEILDRVPAVPPDPGDEMPDDDAPPSAISDIVIPDLVGSEVASDIATLIDDLCLSTERVTELTGLTSKEVFWIVGRGDPLGLSDERLQEVLFALESFERTQGRKP